MLVKLPPKKQILLFFTKKPARTMFLKFVPKIGLTVLYDLVHIPFPKNAPLTCFSIQIQFLIEFSSNVSKPLTLLFSLILIEHVFWVQIHMCNSNYFKNQSLSVPGRLPFNSVSKRRRHSNVKLTVLI